MTATGGRWHGSVPEMVAGIATDSRNFQPGAAFLALRGPSFDGHAFGASVADRAVALIGDSEGVPLWADLDISKLEVKDTLQALGNIAHAWRLRLEKTTVIAITGSFGKTSLRSILEAGFTALGFNIAATRANLNNLIGVPQTLLAVPVEAEIAVIECGISETGEMARLAAMVQPDIAVLTGITGAHAEGLGGLSGVVSEKALLLEHLNENGWCALGGGVSGLLRSNRISAPLNAIDVDQTSESDVVCWQLVGRELLMSWRGQEASLQLALPAAHWASNIAFAASIMLRYLDSTGREAELAKVADAISGWQPPAGRMQQCEGVNGCLVLDDCYNANPTSMQAAINTLRSLDGGRIAVLGDMGELGEDSDAAHGSINLQGVDRIYLIGPRMQALAAIHPEASWFATSDEAIAALANETFDEGDTVLVKASRSMHLESVVQLLCRAEVAHAL
ncbi:UDP-N-acetylmuramoyl-tripeptide--D-alanyl-D-alanine ligase [Mariprofundus ferrinatatus]|uniref:UDP-N-acetylmuramoyl-tripeptide--D-alanyl-D-alanine ligase n=2 Tax=Mariprofundus ferrinatatus TaxID=1921087 RepID=A0A2K8L6E7_9PROT|nr:UDP-N-acetylmuramoyl-tripeptide--D-alanyl-D-alanine ligase [Mariprofundus ferrinatatus]